MCWDRLIDAEEQAAPKKTVARPVVTQPAPRREAAGAQPMGRPDELLEDVAVTS